MDVIVAKKKPFVLLVCSSGGHFQQLFSLKSWWAQYAHVWVTFSGQDTECLLREERKYFAYQPTNRNVVNLILNFFLALRVIRQEKPSIVVSTGAGVAVPFVYAAWLLGVRTVYLESLTRITSLSLSGKLVRPVVTHLLVQWPELTRVYPKAVYQGQVV